MTTTPTPMRLTWRPDIESFEAQDIQLADMDTILRATPGVTVEDLAAEHDGGVVTLDGCSLLWMNGALTIVLPNHVAFDLDEQHQQ